MVLWNTIFPWSRLHFFAYERGMQKLWRPPVLLSRKHESREMYFLRSYIASASAKRSHESYSDCRSLKVTNVLKWKKVVHVKNLACVINFLHDVHRSREKLSRAWTFFADFKLQRRLNWQFLCKTILAPVEQESASIDAPKNTWMRNAIAKTWSI